MLEDGECVSLLPVKTEWLWMARHLLAAVLTFLSISGHFLRMFLSNP